MDSLTNAERKVPRYSEKQKAALDALMRDDVYRHGMEIINSQGLAMLTLERLAQAVGVSRATLYNYFADRDAILEFLDDRTFTPVLEKMEEIADGDLEPADKLRAIATEVFDRVYENTGLVVALSPEKFRASQRDCHLEQHRRAHQALERVVREGVERKVFRDLPADITARLILGTITGFIDSMTYSGTFVEAEEIVPTLMEIVLGGLSR